MDESFIIANGTNVGRVRQVNEDSMVTFDSPNGRVLAVCDGMGGQAAGDLASRLACDIITDILTNHRFDSPAEAITRACMAANQAIVHRATQNPELEGMGSTCVIIIIKDGLVYYGWIGDSRIYYIYNNQITQLSHDQSYVQQLVDEGSISAQEAFNHPQKNEILNALGLESMTPPEICVSPLSPAPGGVVMLCSDGLSGMVDDNTMANIVSNLNVPLQTRVNKLIALACENGGTDNITVQLVQFGRPGKGGAMGSSKDGAKPMFNWMWIAIAAVAIAAIVAMFLFFRSSSADDQATQSSQNHSTVQTPSKTHSKTTTKPSTSTSTGSSSGTSTRKQPTTNTSKQKTNKQTKNNKKGAAEQAKKGFPGVNKGTDKEEPKNPKPETNLERKKNLTDQINDK